MRLGEETRLMYRSRPPCCFRRWRAMRDRVDVVAIDTEVRARVAGERGPRPR